MLLVLLALAGAACSGGGGGRSARPATPTPSELAPGAPAPAVLVSIVRLEGASGPGGSFVPGDRLAVVFDVRHADGAPWTLAEMESAQALVSGPTFLYQRVLPLRDDVAARAEPLRPGRWRYAFADPLPKLYAPPYNDTAAFGRGDGELAGERLLAGTYTVGLSLRWRYTVLGQTGEHGEVGEATADFLVGGGAGTLRPRRAAGAANCARCHARLEAHGGRYRSLTLCLLCHTAGAEDANDPAVAGGTPGVSIDSRVLFHRIHDAAHLPSVVGIGVRPDGTKDYGAPPRPLLFAGAGGALHDDTTVDFPVWPNRTIPMPRDLGYSALGPAEQLQEDRVGTGVTACYVCHGDPDGGGPLGAPEEGELHWREPSRRACGACHDDIDWSLPYVGGNGDTMPPQPDDSLCFLCHDSTFPGPLSVIDAHRHPLRDRAFDPGLSFRGLEVLEGAGGDGDGTIDPGEGVTLSFTLADEAGASHDPAELDVVRAILSGPTTSSQLVVDSPLPAALFSGGPPWSVPLLETEHLEILGTSTAASGETFSTRRAPHVALPGAETHVLVRTGYGAAQSLLAASVQPPTPFVDVQDASAFRRDDFLVLDDGVPGLEELLQVQHVEGSRLWFSSPAAPDYPPGPRRAHGAGATVRAVVLAPRVEGVDYSLDAATGRVVELGELGVGDEVVATYVTPFEMPAAYGLPLNDSPDLGLAEGEWAGLPLVPGTYRVVLSGWSDLPYTLGVEPQTYRVSALPAAADVQVAGATTPQPYALVERSSACDDCHQDLRYHDGSWRGLDACLACHGTAGAEDRPRYVAGSAAPETPGVRVDFRSLVHRLHRGAALADPGFFTVGDGRAPYPLDFALHFWADVRFPAQPGGTEHCELCHGASGAWRAPGAREHPAFPETPVSVWSPICVACHDSASAAAHVASEVSPAGVEACPVCHGPGRPVSVEAVHLPRSELGGF